MTVDRPEGVCDARPAKACLRVVRASPGGGLAGRISHIGAIDTVRVLANEERLRLLASAHARAGDAHPAGDVVGSSPGFGTPPPPESRAGGACRIRRTRPTEATLGSSIAPRRGLTPWTSWCCRRRASAGCSSSWGVTTLRWTFWPADCGRPGGPRRDHDGDGKSRGADRPAARPRSCRRLSPLRRRERRLQPHVRAGFVPGRALMLVTLAHRQQGLDRPGRQPGGAPGSGRRSLSRRRLVNRNRGSGTRVWLDRLLAVGAVDPCG